MLRNLCKHNNLHAISAQEVNASTFPTIRSQQIYGKHNTTY